ncbi:putative membrane protein [Francisella tularensis subsp. novicida D9876]|uniref:hypothetical protein n=1 Tax=Francisella tularensis TaxID=263 RepID=UPI000303D7D9|nr:hypothetical protein [Francisella tularensis]AJI74054.1 putative membrane protein [Francisella tularensis subsp. novicida D9876]
MSMLQALFIVLTPMLLIYCAPILIVFYLQEKIVDLKIIDRLNKILKWYYRIVFTITIIAMFIISPVL